jgi:TonB family protein
LKGFAECNVAHFRKGRDFGSSVFVSISPHDFNLNKLVCLAHSLRHKRRLDGDTFNVLFFSSDKAAIEFQPPVEGYQPGWPASGQQLHAMYLFNQKNGGESLDILPLGYQAPPSVNTTIKLPAATDQNCKLQIQGRCLMVVIKPVVYPEEALEKRASGKITLAATIDSQGRVVNAKILEADRTPASVKQTLANAAIQNLKGWQFNKGSNEQAIRITYSYKIDPSLSPALQTDVKWELPTQIVIRHNPSK